MPVVSVIITAYEAEAFIATAIRSALEQTLADIEVIVVDDGSRDATLEVATAAAAGDARMRLIVQPRNAGVATARNAALAQASGTWIAVLDADDTFAPERLERMVAAGERLDADLIADNIALVHADGRASPAFAVPKRFARIALDARRFVALDTPGLESLPIGFMKPLMRRSFLARYDLRYADDLSTGEDFDLYVRALLRGARLYFLTAAYYRALVRTDSLSRKDPAKNDEAIERSLRRLTLEAQCLGRRDAARMLARRGSDLTAYQTYTRLSDALHQGRAAEALTHFRSLARGSYVWRRFGDAALRRVMRRSSTA